MALIYASVMQNKNDRMALIYANAVNKRMNHPLGGGKPSKKTSIAGCPSPRLSDEREKSLSIDNGMGPPPSRKQSAYARNSQCSNPPCMHKHSTRNRSSERHRPVQRSKTSCGEWKKRKSEEDILRKTSQPAMTQSVMAPSMEDSMMMSCSSISTNEKDNKKSSISKKSLTKSHELVQKMEKVTFSEDPPELRRLSVSLDAEQWKEEEKKEKDGAFQKMKRKLSKWRFSAT